MRRILTSILLGFALLGLPGQVHAAANAATCTTRHTFLGEYPSSVQNFYWTGGIQGITHDERHWYLSDNPEGVFVPRLNSDGPEPPNSKCAVKYETERDPYRPCYEEPGGDLVCPEREVFVGWTCKDALVWKVDVSVDLERPIDCNDAGVQCSRHWSNHRGGPFWRGYHHVGDISYFDGFILVPIAGGAEGPAIAVYDAESLAYVTYAPLPAMHTPDVPAGQERTQDYAGMVAVDPDGQLYSSDNTNVTFLFRYRVDWGRLRTDGTLVIAPAGTVSLVYPPQAETPQQYAAPLNHMQGAAFSEDGRFLYLTNGYRKDDAGAEGIHVYEIRDPMLESGCRNEGCEAVFVDRSFQGNESFVPESQREFAFELTQGGVYQNEAEGITIWNLDWTSGEGEFLSPTQVHAIYKDLDKGPFFGGHDVSIRHYRADVRCPVLIGLEAEHATRTGLARLEDHPEASRSRYVWTPQGAGGYAGAMRFSFEVPHAGTYVIWGRQSSDSYGNNSFQVSMDGTPRETWDTPVHRGGVRWVWHRFRARHGAPVRIYTLEAGRHELEIVVREDGTRLDRILITDDFDFVPFETWIEAESASLFLWGPSTSRSLGSTWSSYLDRHSEETALDLFRPFWEAWYVSPMRTAWDYLASGGRFLFVPNGASGSTAAMASYPFEAPVTGRYAVWARTHSPTNRDNSFFVSMGGTPEATWDTRVDPNWVWGRVTARHQGPAAWQLQKGLQRVMFRGRETGTGLDRIFVTNDPGFELREPRCRPGECLSLP